MNHYLKTRRPKRTIRARQFENFIKTNIVENSECNNKKSFQTISAKSDIFKNSYFVRTVYDWNKLSDNIVNSDTVESFKANLTNIQ